MVEVLHPSMSSALFRTYPEGTVGAGPLEEPRLPALGEGHIPNHALEKGTSGISSWLQGTQRRSVELPTPPIEMADTQFNPLLGAHGPQAYYKGTHMVPSNPNSHPRDTSIVSRMNYMSKAPPSTESRRFSTQTNGGDYERSATDSRRHSHPTSKDDGDIASYLQIPSSVTEVGGNLAELAAKVSESSHEIDETKI